VIISQKILLLRVGPLPLDNSERLLLREGVVSELPADLFTNASSGKNVMLVIGDGMVSRLRCYSSGWTNDIVS
jgi:hypothetical protein